MKCVMEVGLKVFPAIVKGKMSDIELRLMSGVVGNTLEVVHKLEF